MVVVVRIPADQVEARRAAEAADTFLKHLRSPARSHLAIPLALVALEA